MGIFRKIERSLLGRKDRYVDTHLDGYNDKDEILLHACFSVLVDYVELELAWMNLVCGDEKGFRKWWKMRLISLGGRLPEFGLEYLLWEPVTSSDKEIKDLYLWWKERKDRPDPYDAAEVTEEIKKVQAQKRPVGMTENQLWMPSSPELSTALGKAYAIEESYHQEDEDMLVRLMKVRRSLWT